MGHSQQPDYLGEECVLLDAHPPGTAFRSGMCTRPQWMVQAAPIMCESWNHSFGHLVGHKNPGLYHIIKSMSRDQLGVLTEMERMSLGHPSSQRVTKAAEQHQAKLKRVCLKLSNGRMSIVEFLHAIGRHIRLVA